MSKQCSEKVYDRSGLGSYQCIVPPKYTYNGKQYCHVHYPPNVEKRKKKANERHEAERVKWRKKWDAEEQAQKRNVILESACAGVTFTGDPDGAVRALVEALRQIIDNPDEPIYSRQIASAALAETASSESTDPIEYTPLELEHGFCE